MLRICARYLYGWHCDHEGAAEGLAAVEGWTDWSAYPESWPTAQRATLPKGVAKLDDGIRESAQRRVTQIRKDLNNAGPHYPRGSQGAGFLAYRNLNTVGAEGLYFQ